MPLSAIDVEFRVGGKGGDGSVAAWREAHEHFWHTIVPGVTLDDRRRRALPPGRLGPIE